MISKPKRDYWIAILLAFLVVICCVPLAGANDGDNQQWVQQTSNAEWLGRFGHSSVVLPDGSIVLMGGANAGTLFNDVWRSWDNGETWTQVNASAGWTGRCFHTSVVMPDGSIVVIGGHDGLCRNDVWRSRDNGETWTQVTPNAEWLRRLGHSSVVLPDGSIVLMGGLGQYTYLNDIWRSWDNGKTWTQVNPSAGWTARARHTSVVMPDGSIVLIGGIDGSDRNDVWRSWDNGETWTQVNASAGWAPRHHHSCVVMPDGSIVLIGGYNDVPDGTGLAYMNDVWRSTDNGEIWKELTPPLEYIDVFDPEVGWHKKLSGGGAEWSARSTFSSVAMPDGSIILMGGDDSTYKNDVWRLMPAGSISIRSNPSGAKIYLDNVNQGVTPQSLENIPFGVHVVKLTLDNYQDYTTTVVLNNANPLQTINAVLIPIPTPTPTPIPTPPQTGSISISSVPVGASIYLDNIYKGVTPQSLENIPFGVHVVKLTLDNYQDWSDNVELTAASPSASVNAVLKLMPPTFSITNVIPYEIGRNIVVYQLNHEEGWRQVFEKTGVDVKKSKFGVNPGYQEETLNDATLHWHFGHGGPKYYNNSQGEIVAGNGHTFLDLPGSGNVYPNDITEEWGGNNKWVVLQSCFILSDTDWGNVLGTSHGIVGYATVTNMDQTLTPELPVQFITYANNGHTLYDSWKKATIKIYHNQKVGTTFVLKDGYWKLDDYTQPDNIIAATIFKTTQQRDNDYLPGTGHTIANDNYEDNVFIRDTWDCMTGLPREV